MKRERESVAAVLPGFFSRVAMAIIAATLLAVLALVLSGGVAIASITPTTNANQIAGAIARNSSQVTGASFDAVPPQGTPNAVSDSALTAFPTNGPDYGILTTGDANFADDENSNVPDSPAASDDKSADDGGGNVRGDSDFDVTILKVDLDVPSGANCLSVDFQFLSEEFPEFVGTEFNDAFIAELDTSNWTTSGSNISAPNNFAFDQNGDPISVNSTGNTSVSPSNSVGTTYDAATQLLQARTQVTPGAHSLYLSIFDQGDHILDAAVFVDDVALFHSAQANCEEGAEPPDPDLCTITGTNGDNALRGTRGRDVICGLGGNDDIGGLGGDDILRGGSGNNVLHGGEGDDELTGGSDKDVLHGGPGKDELTGGSGKDALNGEGGRDSLDGKDGVKGNDSLDGGLALDSCTADQGDAVRRCEL